MPGRQAHGRPLTSAPKSKATKKSKNRSQKNALNAFGIAQEHFPQKIKKTPRYRQLELEVERKHSRDEEDEEDDEDDEDMPQRKKIKAPRPVSGDAEHGSDSEGNEWTLGGLAEDDDDSEIESDDAFGDSDHEKFQGYSFGGSKSTKSKGGHGNDDDDESEDDSNDDEGQTLGEEAIDLATALDQWEEDTEEEQKDGSKSDSDEASGSETSEGSEEEEDSDEEDSAEEGDEEADPEQLRALRGLVSGFGGEEDDDEDKAPVKQKINLGDLGLGGIDDPFMKQSVKLMKKESKEKKPGATKKLDVPLSRREQGRLDRTVAYEKTNETLDRWTETVKQNRRAEHLVFPLPENSAKAGLDLTEMQPLTASNTQNELESAIFGIMDQSGLSMEKPKKEKEREYDDEGNELSRKEILNRKRIERELQSREAKRAARIKKIKSKAYHRVHRKQRERDEMAAQEAMAEAGEIDSEEEREAQDRRRALERVGLRHKDSKWAKMGSRVKRAVWDDDFRTGLTEMARKDEELRRRVEGRSAVSDDDETSSSGSDSEDGGHGSLRRQLAALEEEDDEPQSKLMSMKFMQKAEAARKQENDDLIKQIRRELDGEEAEESADDGGDEVGRKQYGGAGGKVFAAALDTSKMSAKKPRKVEEDDDDEVTIKLSSNGNVSKAAPAAATSTANTTAGAWSSGEVRRKKKGGSSAKMEDFDLNANIMIASNGNKSKAVKKSSTPQRQNGVGHDSDDDSDDADQHLPLAIRDQQLVARAFAGEDVVGEFEREKEEVAEQDDDKVIDNTLPGWGSWVGDGVSNREKKRHQGRFLTKVEGIKKNDRKDAKLDKVIINEKRIKKNDRYLASQLPHPFESRQQYERSLQQPVGPEWQTKETFQDSTKPRVIMKQGIIAPMSKPRA
ncbi:unnamed protein product [Clonostachys rhizophaga]|uniref:U3 small nucleolar RNA-associated protein 14 n=1 Tax=Clonostachys rhizophaga TaxID=160324 RepID=A0A9N9V3P3_9HYPO|nr:unnamed protein product [Clonostachys rhizophaga]